MAFNWFPHLKLALGKGASASWFTCQSGWQCQEVNNGKLTNTPAYTFLGWIFLRCDPWFPTKMTPTFYTEMDFNPPETLTRILYYQTTQVNNTQLTRNGLDKGKMKAVSHLFLTRREKKGPSPHRGVSIVSAATKPRTLTFMHQDCLGCLPAAALGP